MVLGSALIFMQVCFSQILSLSLSRWYMMKGTEFLFLKKGLCCTNGSILSNSFIYRCHLYLRGDQGLSGSVWYIAYGVKDKDSLHCCNKKNILLSCDHEINNNIMYWGASRGRVPGHCGIWWMGYRCTWDMNLGSPQIGGLWLGVGRAHRPVSSASSNFVHLPRVMPVQI